MKIDSALNSSFRRHKLQLANVNVPINTITDGIIEDVWDVLLSRRIAVDASHSGGKHGSFTLEELESDFTEEAFFCNGGPTPGIFRERLKIVLPNGSYYFSRIDKTTIYSSPLAFFLWTTRSINCTLSHDSMARFVREFDHIVPEIVQKTLSEREKTRKQRVIENIEDASIASKLDRAMSSLGYRHYSWQNNGRHIFINIRVQGHTCMKIKTTFEKVDDVLKQLPDILTDPCVKTDSCSVCFVRC